MTSDARKTAWAAWLAVHGPRQGRFPYRSPAAIERAQRRRLASAVRHAHVHVPHYRRAMGRIGVGPSDIRTAADLARLPLTERSDLQRDPEQFTSRDRPISEYVPLQTGGSTGTAITVYHDRFALVQAGVYYQRAGWLHRRVVGHRLGCRTLAIGHASEPAMQPIDSTFARARTVVRSRLETVSILEPVERGIEAVNRFRPHILRSYGSYLEALFLRLRETGEPFHRPALVVYGADAMPQRARRLIEDEFGIPVLGVYGAYEARHLGFECSARRGFHINTDVYPVRIVDRAGDDVPLGATGEVVVSNLINRATMLLNYRLGDAAAWVPGPCPCGRTLPVLTYVEGRIADWLVMPGGERLHPQTVTVVLEMDPEILRYQVVQSGPDALTVRLVTRSGSDRTALSARVQRELSAVFRDRLMIRPEFVEDLPRTARGKVRTVVGLRTGR